MNQMNQKNMPLIFFAAALAASAAAHAQSSVSPGSNSVIPDAGKSMPAEIDKTGKAQKTVAEVIPVGHLGARDSQFVAAAGTAGATEVDAGKLALSSSSNPKIK